MIDKSPTVVYCHRCIQSLPLLFSDTLHRVFRTLVSCRYGAAHLSRISKSVASRHRSQCRRVCRYITVAGTNGIMLSPSLIGQEVLRYATGISKAASHRKTYQSAECVMARQQSAQCSRDLLIISRHSHSASSTEWMLSYLTPLAMSTRLFLFSKITQLLAAILTTIMPEQQH